MIICISTFQQYYPLETTLINTPYVNSESNSQSWSSHIFSSTCSIMWKRPETQVERWLLIKQNSSVKEMHNFMEQRSNSKSPPPLPPKQRSTEKAKVEKERNQHLSNQFNFQNTCSIASSTLTQPYCRKD